MGVRAVTVIVIAVSTFGALFNYSRKGEEKKPTRPSRASLFESERAYFTDMYFLVESKLFSFFLVTTILLYAASQQRFTDNSDDDSHF